MGPYYWQIWLAILMTLNSFLHQFFSTLSSGCFFHFSTFSSFQIVTTGCAHDMMYYTRWQYFYHTQDTIVSEPARTLHSRLEYNSTVRQIKKSRRLFSLELTGETVYVLNVNVQLECETWFKSMQSKALTIFYSPTIILFNNNIHVGH